MATHCEYIEDSNSTDPRKSNISETGSVASMAHEEHSPSESNEKLQSKKSENSLSDNDSAASASAHVTTAQQQQQQQQHQLGHPHPHLGDDVFENAFDESMECLEQDDADGYESDSEESANEYDNDDAVAMTTTASPNSTSGCRITFPLGSGAFDYHSCSSSSSDGSDDETACLVNAQTEERLRTFFPTDSRNMDIFHSRPYLLPFVERRRLSQCKEEDEDDGDKSPQPHTGDMAALKFDRATRSNTSGTATTQHSAHAAPPPPPPPPPPPLPASLANDGPSLEKFKELEKLRQQFMHKIDSINTNNVEDLKTVVVIPEHVSPPPPPPIPPTILPQSLIDLLQSTKRRTLPMIKAAEPKKAIKSAADEPQQQKSEVAEEKKAQEATVCTTTTNHKIEQASIVTEPSEDSSSSAKTTEQIVSQLVHERSDSTEKLVIKGKFTVTKAKETPELQQLRTEADKMKHLTASANAHTISFPSSYGGYTSVQGLFSQRYGSHKAPAAVPHLSKKFFDASLVEIRTPTSSISSLNQSDTELLARPLSANSSPFPVVAAATPTKTSPLTTSSNLNHHQSYTNCDNSLVKPPRGDLTHLDDVWIKRSTTALTSPPRRQMTDESVIESGRSTAAQSEDEQDGRFPSSRPSSAPAEPNAKAARKASKKMEKEARRQEKEASRREKEARKLERETARRQEREAAKLEKLNRNMEKISRSTERVAATPRSGSLERRRSGEDSPVLNQSTVHGIASPNRRPTIFDVFRQRTKSDTKRKESALAVGGSGGVATAGIGGADSSSASSSTHSGSGIMNQMKVVMQNSGLISGHHHHHSQDKRQHPAVTITGVDGSSSGGGGGGSGSAKNKYKDGSAHPHQGSDAQYYHTVTAVRRSDATRSPMTKVMDLFRSRSNSAATEADRRKARVAAHQQQLAVQICNFYHEEMFSEWSLSRSMRCIYRCISGQTLLGASDSKYYRPCINYSYEKDAFNLVGCAGDVLEYTLLI